MTRWRPLLLGISLLSLAGRSEAITISLSPNGVTTTPGQSFTLDLVVSGLADGEAGTLSGWELDVLFDEALLSLDAVSFGELLGGPADALQDSLPIGAGAWNLAELSLLLATELDPLQGPTFVLATLEFSALVEGTGAVTLANADAADGAGVSFLALVLESAQITVVPEPGTGLLVGGALLALAGWRAARHPRSA